MRHAAEFEAFAQASSNRLLPLAFALTANRHDAWDLFQETVVRVGTRWEKVDDPWAYAHTVMVRLNVDRLRRLRRELVTPFTAGDRPDRGYGVPELDPGVDPWLLRALSRLTPNQRTAVGLRFVADLDVKAVAEHMGCSEGTVRSHLSRGLAQLRASHQEATRPLSPSSESR